MQKKAKIHLVSTEFARLS